MKTKQRILDFAQWYSGMDCFKVEAAYKRYLTETNQTESTHPMRNLTPDEIERFVEAVQKEIDESPFIGRASIDMIRTALATLQGECDAEKEVLLNTIVDLTTDIEGYEEQQHIDQATIALLTWDIQALKNKVNELLLFTNQTPTSIEIVNGFRVSDIIRELKNLTNPQNPSTT